MPSRTPPFCEIPNETDPEFRAAFEGRWHHVRQPIFSLDAVQETDKIQALDKLFRGLKIAEFVGELGRFERNKPCAIGSRGSDERRCDLGQL